MSVCILGVGNEFRCDDGLGLRVVEVLRSWSLPSGVEVAMAPQDPVRLLDLMASYDAAVFVDAAEMGKEPGTIRVLRDVAQWQRITLPATVHGLGLQHVVALAAVQGTAPRDVRLVAVQPGRLEVGSELSREIAARLGDIARTALEEARDALEDIDHR